MLGGGRAPPERSGNAVQLPSACRIDVVQPMADEISNMVWRTLEVSRRDGEKAGMKLSEVIEQKVIQTPVAGGEVSEEAIRRGWLLPFAEGQFVYGPEWTALLRRLQGILLSQAADLGFREYLFPRLIPAEAVHDFRLSQFKPGLLWRADGDRVLDPVQCLPLYQVLRGHRFPSDQLPLMIVETLGGWTWRRERAADLDGAFRAVEFARVEHAWIAPPTEAARIRNMVRDAVVSKLIELGLSVQTVVGEPCMPIEEIELRREEALSADDVPVIDIELRVRPQRDAGVLTPQDFDEIGGCTIEGDHHLASFDIGQEDGGPLWSGCCGIGLNRLVIGFLFQHGFDSSNWPDTVARGFPSPGSHT
jgi:seryl-tRNA synthetase